MKLISWNVNGLRATRMAEHLDCIEANVPYEELIPLAHTVQSDRKLREDNETIRREFYLSFFLSAPYYIAFIACVADDISLSCQVL